MLTLRRYTAADRAAVWALHNTALDAIAGHAGNGPWDDDLHHIDEVYLQPGGAFLVGEVAGELVAMGALLPRGAGTGEIKRMRIHPDHQRRGYGQQLLDALEAAARERGYAKLVLDTTTGQTAARALYEKNGYTEQGRGQLGPFTVIYFAKPLANPTAPLEGSDRHPSQT